jgi:hypothetical protein
MTVTISFVPGTCGSLRRAPPRFRHDLVRLDVALEAQWCEDADRAVGIVEML